VLLKPCLKSSTQLSFQKGDTGHRIRPIFLFMHMKRRRVLSKKKANQKESKEPKDILASTRVDQKASKTNAESMEY